MKECNLPEFQPIKDNIGNLLKKNSHAVLADIRSLCQPVQYKSGEWYKICPTGNHELHDYGAGLLCVHFYTWSNYNVKGLYQPRIYINSLDDGDWEAMGKEYTDKEECDAFIDEHAENLYSELHILPTTERFNEILQPLGMYGGFFN